MVYLGGGPRSVIVSALFVALLLSACGTGTRDLGDGQALADAQMQEDPDDSELRAVHEAAGEIAIEWLSCDGGVARLIGHAVANPDGPPLPQSPQEAVDRLAAGYEQGTDPTSVARRGTVFEDELFRSRDLWVFGGRLGGVPREVRFAERVGADGWVAERVGADGWAAVSGYTC